MNKYLIRKSPLSLLVTSTLLFSSALAAQEGQSAEAPTANEERSERIEREVAAQRVARAAEVRRVRADAMVARAEAREQAAAAYQEALKSAETEQREALRAVEQARRELEQQAAQAAKLSQEEREAQRESAANDREFMQKERAELMEVERQLERAHNSLRRASREVERVHREISRPSRVRVIESHHAPSVEFAFSSDDKAIIGVVLGDSNDTGVELLGVSPDGPAERAGLEPGDKVVAIMGTPLGNGDGSAAKVLIEALKDLKVGDEVDIEVERDGKRENYTIAAEKREPYTWHSYSRLSSTTSGQSAPIVISERIEVPKIDRERLDSEIARLHEEFEGDAEAYVYRFSDDGSESVIEIDNFSDFGTSVISGTNVWFGMSLTRGVKLAELGSDLGDYFGTKDGVLVLKAAEDNALNLIAGDVIVSVQGQDVSKPADVMRAMRDLESGSTVTLDIQRQQKPETLEITVPDTRQSFNLYGLPALDGSQDLEQFFEKRDLEQLFDRLPSLLNSD